jgi:uncharacterized protein YigE (DUF2233 family)
MKLSNSRSPASRNAWTTIHRGDGVKLATVRRVRTIPFLLAFFAVSALAQSNGSSERPQYEKETNGPHGECRSDWTRVSNGLDYRAIQCLGDTRDLDVNVIRVDLDQYRLNIATGSASSARRVAQTTDADFVINANFFDAARRPLGVLASSGNTIQGPKSNSWQSIFLVTRDGTPKIILPSQWSTYRSKTWMAAQAGPRLVVGGHTNRVHQSYAAARAGVCITKDASVLFFATPQERKFDMYEIARIARRGPEDGGLGCHDAMLFDGGHSTQIYLEGDTKRVTIDGDPVPVFVYATRR